MRLSQPSGWTSVRTEPETEYSFKHVLTREAIYDTLPEERRATLHSLAADAVERAEEAVLGDPLPERAPPREVEPGASGDRIHCGHVVAGR